jgi:hypothetical protein
MKYGGVYVGWGLVLGVYAAVVGLFCS